LHHEKNTFLGHKNIASSNKIHLGNIRVAKWLLHFIFNPDVVGNHFFREIASPKKLYNLRINILPRVKISMGVLSELPNEPFSGR
jgi:hypothetical protein